MVPCDAMLSAHCSGYGAVEVVRCNAVLLVMSSQVV
jgi:hypothetical protein